MHFCKTKPPYYLEIARCINSPPEKCLLARNETLKDFNASEAGIDIFLVENLLIHRINKEPSCTYRGSLHDLALFIKSLERVKKN